ncbi:MAG TPA: LacI family DNA-binding transcriptional regulator [Bryobacteraceae bacterium]|nr:LacI family DNA-binding transcriptional regulator [Bryobacteraceae bacterium]
MAVRIKEIAGDLGVSLMTVSKALRNHRDISEKTGNRVLMRMSELNRSAPHLYSAPPGGSRFQPPSVLSGAVNCRAATARNLRRRHLSVMNCWTCLPAALLPAASTVRRTVL